MKILIAALAAFFMSTAQADHDLKRGTYLVGAMPVCDQEHQMRRVWDVMVSEGSYEGGREMADVIIEAGPNALGEPACAILTLAVEVAIVIDSGWIKHEGGQRWGHFVAAYYPPADVYLFAVIPSDEQRSAM